MTRTMTSELDDRPKQPATTTAPAARDEQAARAVGSTSANPAQVDRMIDGLFGEPRAAWGVEAARMASALGLGPVRVEADERARSVTEGHGARGVALDGVVYLHPDRVTPGTETGREVLAHELVHLAQARLPAGTGGGRRAAECEAAAVAPIVARGGAVPGLAHAIDLSRAAGDGDATILPDTPTRYGAEIVLAEWKKDPIRASAKLQVYVKDGSPAVEHKDHNVTDKLAIANAEHMLRLEGNKITERAAISIGKLEDILDLGTVEPLPGLSLKVETKAFETSFSTDDVSLDLARIALVGDADFTEMVKSSVGKDDPLLAGLVVKFSIRIEIRIPAKIAADLYRLRRSTTELRAAREASIERKAAKRALAKAKKRAGKLGIELAEHPEVLEELRGAEAALSKAEKVWSVAKRGAERAAKTIAEVGGRLAETGVGRVLGGLAAKAMRVLPVLDVIMIGQDLVEAGHLLVELIRGDADLALGGGDGGGAEEGSDQEGDGTGTEEIDREEPAKAGGDAGAKSDASGSGGGDSTTATAVASRVTTATTTSAGARDGKGGAAVEPGGTVAPSDAPTHHAVAAEVLGALEVDAGGTGHALSPDDAVVIDQVIPPDLDRTEIAQLIGYLQGAQGGEATADFVESVVSAMQYVRPFGEKRPEAQARDAADAHADAPAATARGKHAHRHHRARATGAAKTSEPVVVDVRADLIARSVFVDGSPPRVTIPSSLLIGSFRVHVRRVGAHVNMAADGDTATVTVALEARQGHGLNTTTMIRTDNGTEALRAGGSYHVTYVIASTDPRQLDSAQRNTP